MDTINALLLSNSTNYGQSYMEHVKAEIADFLGDVKDVLFIPYAGVTISYDQYTATVQDNLAPFGIQVTGIHTVDDPKEAIKNAKAIAVGGGNTFRLLQQLYEKELVGLINNQVNLGTYYVGWSAGSNVAGQTICTTNDMPIVEPESFNAIGLVRYQINPHYSEATVPNHGGESRKARLLEYITLNKTDVVCLPEGSWVKIVNGVSTYHGNENMKVYKYPNQVLDFELDNANKYLNY